MSSSPAYPPAPWLLHGTMWLSVFWLGAEQSPLGRRGPVGVAWVDYRDPSPLAYRELLVAGPVRRRRERGPRLQVEISDIWVDSPASRDGGRALWAIPKDLADFTVLGQAGGTGTTWAARVDDRPVASATFRELVAPAARTPYRFATQQRWPQEHPRAGATVVAPVRGSARVRSCRSRWHVDPAGPLGGLAGRRPLMSVCLEDFALSFG